LSVTEPFTQPS